MPGLISSRQPIESHCERVPRRPRGVLRGVVRVFLVLNSSYLILTALAWMQVSAEVRRRPYLGLDELFRSPLTPGISVLVPAFNEEAVIVESVRSCRTPIPASRGGDLQRRLEGWNPERPRACLRPRSGQAGDERCGRVGTDSNHVCLETAPQPAGGQQGERWAVRCAQRHAPRRKPALCVRDRCRLLASRRTHCSRSRSRSSTILHSWWRQADRSGSRTVAARRSPDGSSNIRLPKSGLATIQVIEYLRAFLIARAGWSRHNALGIISGAFGLFDRNILETVGGYWTDTVGEDFELTLRLHRYLRDRDEPYRIVYVPDPVCWTEVPEQFSTLSRQRRRWQRGLWQGLHRHEGMMLRKRYGAIGMVSMPHFALFEFLSPVFALGGLVITIVLGLLSQLSLSYVIAYGFVTLGLSVLLTLTTITVEEFGFNRYRRRARRLASSRTRSSRASASPAPRRLASDWIRGHRSWNDELGRPATPRIRPDRRSAIADVAR